MSKWRWIAMIVKNYNDANFSPTDPKDLGNDVCYETVPEWLKEDHVAEVFCRRHQYYIKNDVKHVLSSEYEANNEHELDPNCSRERSKKAVAFEKILITNLILCSGEQGDRNKQVRLV